MINEIMLAIIQAVTEFLPISSSGHLALFSNLFTKTDIFLFTVLHLASLLAVIIFTRKEIAFLLKFNRDSRPLWGYLVIASIPAAFAGIFLTRLIESTFASLLFLAITFFITGVVLFLTKYSTGNKKLNKKSALLIGLFQVLALFPGISRSGMTISAGMFAGVGRERAARFSFLLLIPLALGAFALEFKEAYFSFTLVLSFFVCLLLSLLFLKFLLRIVRNNHFWLFSFYCWLLAIISLLLWLTM